MYLAQRSYCGRFAPSPTGKLHRGSLVAALASYLDARAHDGQWLIRIEDIDPPRDIEGADVAILQALTAFGLESDAPVWWQHDRYDAYQAAFDQLRQGGHVFGCACSRKAIEAYCQAHQLPPHVYPGLCRLGTHGQAPRAWRFLVPAGTVNIVDRWQGLYRQDVAREVGDFVIKRADGLWAYQLAVVVDDIAQGVTHIVRGADLLDNTPRQCLLYDALGAPRPQYGHIPLVLNAQGTKLSKQAGATAVDTTHPLVSLQEAAHHLELGDIHVTRITDFLRVATQRWTQRWLTHDTPPR